MKNNEKLKNLCIIALIGIVLVLSVIGTYAWSKYQTSNTAGATAQVAKWSFKIVDGVTETTDVIDFAVTRTDGHTHVAENKIAPGTFGEFEIGIDARGTETILEYEINVDLENKPTNLKLYSDSEKTQEITVKDNAFSLSGFMSLEDVKEIKTVTIYWDWPYITGDTEEEQNENDDIDTEDAGKTITMSVSVTGTEVLEKTVYLSDVVKVGDYVNYDANSNGTYTYTTESSLTGTSDGINTFSSSDTFDSSTPAQWRVLSIDETTGTVDLVSVEPTANTVTLFGIAGFNNVQTVVDKVGDVYGHGKGATGGRSISEKDINLYSTYNPYTFGNSYSSTGYYGGTRTYDNNKWFLLEVKDSEGNITGYTSTTMQATYTNPAQLTQTYYYYTASDFFNSTLAFDTLFRKSTDTSRRKETYWLPSQRVNLDNKWCDYYLSSIDYDRVYNTRLYSPNGGESANTYSVCPVVTLKSNLKITGQDENGVWQLKVD